MTDQFLYACANCGTVRALNVELKHKETPTELRCHACKHHTVPIQIQMIVLGANKIGFCTPDK